ncbi:MAG: SGNH/GDSL hydrolase family protein [Clostridia bacterium]|nr:SGNH/GDSL hydrolase family protein [Clostridia bacterium]
MDIRKKLMMTREELEREGAITIVVFGDSVSHGSLLGEIDYESVYWNLLRKRINEVRTYVPVNVICSAIGGTGAYDSLSRLDGQVLRYSPDLVIVCFGLNDVNGELDTYISALERIFTECKGCGAEVIFMTPNMLNTYVASDTPAAHLEYAKKTVVYQTSGKMDEFMTAAKALAERMDVTVCDCYAKWKKLAETEDTTKLLINRINHPTREMHKLFADSLFETIFGDNVEMVGNDSTMFKK